MPEILRTPVWHVLVIYSIAKTLHLSRKNAGLK
jgi:hypothetical protein